jgi:hypothetical protein
MFMADTNYQSVCVDIGGYGEVCDSTIFKRPYVMDINSNKCVAIPGERPFAGTESPTVPRFFVGDEGFALNKNILQPFS